MLRRRRRESGDQPSPYDESRTDDQPPVQDTGGPWDIADDYPETERIDCGSLLIPVREGFDVQINVAEEQGAWVAVVHGESGMQLQAFAAPRSGGLWDEVRHEIAANIAESGGSCQESRRARRDRAARPGAGGGRERPARAAAAGQVPRVRRPALVPARRDQRPGRHRLLGRVPFDELFADVVVVRGDYPAPPREQLEIRLPEEARQALEAQLAAGERRLGPA